MEFIRGKKIFLGPINFDEIEEEYYYSINQEYNRTGLTSGFIPKSKKDLKSFIEKNQNSEKNIIFGIYLSDNSKYIGNVKIGPIDWKNRVAEFGRFIFSSDARGKGIGTEVTKLIISYCFDSLNLNKVISGCLENNIASRKSNEKCNMTLEGKLIDHIYEQGKYHSVLRFAILKKEYDN